MSADAAKAADLHSLGLIARGAQGSVLLVYQRSQRRFLALKIVRLRGGEAEARQRLARQQSQASGEADPWAISPEASGLGIDAPPEIAALVAGAGLDLGDDGQWLWLLMPYVHGPNAMELALGDEAFSWAEVAALGAQVAARLARCPEGQAHRDLKPENVVVDASGRPFLVDREADEAPGTPGYAAPKLRAAPAKADLRADLFALGRTCQRLLARAPPKPTDAPDMAPPWPEIPEEASPETRRGSRELIQLVKELCAPDPADRGDAAGAARRFLEIAAGLGGPDLAGTVKASVARAKLPERLELFAQQMSRLRAERGGDSVRSEPFDEAQGRLRRGPNPGQVRPSTSLGANGSALRNKLAWGVGALAVLATAGFASYRHLHPAHVNPLPSIPAPDQPERPWNAGCKILPPAKPLAVLEEAPPGDAVFQETIHQPVDRFSLNLLYGPDVLVMESPKPGDTCKVRLPPATYQRNVLYPNGKSYKDTLELEAGSPNHDITYAYGNQAPLSGRETGSILVTAAQGPTLLSLGPAWIDDATWDADAGALSIASYWGDCKDPTRELPWSPQGRGASDAKFHLDRTERLCAYPKPDAKDGFRVRLAQSEDLGQPDPSPQSGRFADATPAEPPIDPAKRFNAPYEIPELVASTLIMPGPAVVTKGDWNLEAGSLKIGGDRNCTSTLSDFAYRTVHTIDERPLDIPPDKSLCAVPNEDQPGGHFVANLEGYFK